MFSMAGIPPLAGFFAKFYILFAGLESSFNLAVIGAILLSVISAFYYIRLIKIMFFDESNNGLLYNINNTNYGHSLVLGSTFLFILFLFICPSSLITLTQYYGLGIFM
jgi:NADH-quinone oxidoreductase subunit N